MRVRWAAFAVLGVLARAGVGWADPTDNPYAMRGPGIDLSAERNGAVYQSKPPQDASFVAVTPLFGTALGGGLRDEITVDSSRAAPGGLTGPDLAGGAQATHLFANLTYGFGGTSWPVSPHLGVGAGVSMVNSGSAGGPNLPLGGARETGLTYQATIGFDYPLGERVRLGADYRLRGNEIAEDMLGVTARAPALEHDFMLTLRYDFGGQEGSNARHPPAVAPLYPIAGPVPPGAAGPSSVPLAKPAQTGPTKPALGAEPTRPALRPEDAR